MIRDTAGCACIRVRYSAGTTYPDPTQHVENYKSKCRACDCNDNNEASFVVVGNLSFCLEPRKSQYLFGEKLLTEMRMSD